MGVPKFFRYISERYPCLSELAREQAIPEFDNLYLDMNGIIHTCSHPDDGNIHFNITEENMFKDIFNYIEKLFFLIKPQKLFFMAVDGVAPRAKMNQQRSRRFRSAKEAELLEQQAVKRGEVVKHERFDSNCITPGTEFMERLHEALSYFIKSKISTDPQWQKCRVILSGHNCPGEGEHKIMDYVRYMKSQTDYDPNTRHCLYGLDADLIILGLCTHELHFVVLREEVKFTKKPKRASVEETRFFLLHLGLLREYLEMEFNDLKKINPDFDIAKLIDDWVLMGFLVGNDFIPHLPCLHISSNALPLLYKTYIKVYKDLGGNINESGILNLERLEKYFAALAEVEYEIFQENHADLKYFEGKMSKNGVEEAFDFDVAEINNDNADDDLAKLIESSRQFLEDDDYDSADEDQHLADEFETYKRNYYMHKLQQTMSTEQKRGQAIGYVTALQWILDYYYRGVQSWDWYYPHHYSPFISDLHSFKDHVIKFNMGKPFLPFEQLLAVLPAASKQLLPDAYRDLMTDAKSDVIHFYPNDFETDLNGKKHEWEAVVLIPFIDEALLLKSMKVCEKNLSANESNRNKHGPMLQYDYVNSSQGSAKGFQSFKTIHNVFCTETPVWSHEIAISSVKSVCVELPNAARHVFFPGFPTMKHLKYNFELRNARVKVFDQPSRNENLILKPLKREKYDDIVEVAGKVLNQIVYIGWPHLIKAKVFAVSDGQRYIDTQGIRDDDSRIYEMRMKTAKEHLSSRMGIEFQDYTVLLHTYVHANSSYTCGSKGEVKLTDTWSTFETVYPAQGVVSDIAVYEGVKKEFTKVEELFPSNSTVFFVGTPYFASEGKVLDPKLVYSCGRLKVEITVLPEPDFREAKHLQLDLESDYVGAHQVCMILGINYKCLSRVTGTMFVVSGQRRSNLPENVPRVNIGMQFKFPKQQEERAGYSRRINNQWHYSSKAISLMHAYCCQFPKVFEYLSRNSERMDNAFESDIFGVNADNDEQNGGQEGAFEQNLKSCVAWLNQQEHLKAEKVACGSMTVEKEAIEIILERVEALKFQPMKNVKLQVKPHLLLKPDVTSPSQFKKGNFSLFDRVVVVQTTYLVPIGSKGTVVGIYPISDPNPVRLECIRAVDNILEVLFDNEIPNANDIYGIAHQRVYRVPESAVLAIYAPDRKKHEMNSETGVREKTNPSYHQGGPQFGRVGSSVNGVSHGGGSSRSGENYHSKSATSNGPSAVSDNKGRDFWLPSSNANEKVKQNPPVVNNWRAPAGSGGRQGNPPISIMARPPPVASSMTTSSPQQLQQPPPQPMKVPHPPQALAPKSYHHENLATKETQLLKSLLGISGDSEQNRPKGESLPVGFKQNLPQPPPGWMNDAKAAGTSRSQPPLPSGQQLPQQQKQQIKPQQHHFYPQQLNQQQQPHAPVPSQSTRTRQQSSSSPQPSGQMGPQQPFGYIHPPSMQMPRPVMGCNFPPMPPMPLARPPPSFALVQGHLPSPLMPLVPCLRQPFMPGPPLPPQKSPSHRAQNSYYPSSPPPQTSPSENNNFSADSLQQKGAFIPMQVLRARHHPQQQQPQQQHHPQQQQQRQPPSQQKSKQPRQGPQQRQPKQRPAVPNANATEQVQQVMAQIDINATPLAEGVVSLSAVTTTEQLVPNTSSTDNKLKAKRKAPRTPKIGARFDFA